MKKYQFSKEKYLSTPANAAMYKACKLLGEVVDKVDGKFVTLDAEGIGEIEGTYIHIDWCEEVPEPVGFMTAANSGKRIKHEGWDGYYFLHEALHILQNRDAALDLINGKWLIED